MSELAEYVATHPAIGPPGERLYHYTRLDTALQRIVPSQELKLGPFSSMRDPRESADWSIAVGGYAGDVDLRNDVRDFWAFNRRINELKSYVKVLSLTQDTTREGDRTAVAFGRGYAHPRLWEHYGDNHRGVCLCFDLKTLVQRLGQRLTSYGRLHHGPVLYENREIAPEALNALVDKLREDGPDEAASAHLRDNIGELLFTKLKDWETEAEYRFVIQTEERDGVYARVRPALRAVIFGADEGSRFYEPSFAKHCDPRGVEIFHMRWNHGFPHLAPRHDPPARKAGSGAQAPE
jgi:hypothetical protein